jgi:RNA polymerase sigma-70 factor (ECF subfamily)
MTGVGLVGLEVDGTAATTVLPAVGTVGHHAGQNDDHAVSIAESMVVATAVLPAVGPAGHAAVTADPAQGVPGPRLPMSESVPPEVAVEITAEAMAALTARPEPSMPPITTQVFGDVVPAELAAVEIPPETIAALTAPPEPPAPAEIPLLERLVAAAVGGDAGAKQRLLAEIHPLVLRYCRGRLGRQETVIGSADDVAQEVCLAVVGALPNYTIKGLSFRAFVYGIAAHKVTDAFRAIGRNKSEPMAELPDTAVLHDGPEQRLLAGELAERLGGMLHRLTPRQREVLILRIVAGLSAEEVAHIVGSTPGAVRVTQHRALNRLRAVMAGRAGTEDSLTDD